MIRFILSSILLITFSASFSQKVYFIYLQSEPEQVFFVKMNESIHNSTSSGYLILSRLRDSSYTFNIGFPQNKWPVQKFIVDVKGKDHGYVLKNFGEKGWGLVDLQNMGVQMNLSTSSNATEKREQKEVSEFTDILSKAANDPSLKEKPIASQPISVKEDPVKTVTEIPIVKNNEPGVDKKEEQAIAKKEEPVVRKDDSATKAVEQPIAKKEENKNVPAEEYKMSVVTKKSESSTSEGLGLTFIDDYRNGKKDTIRIFIPNPKTRTAEVKESPKEELKFLDISSGNAVKEEDRSDTVKEKDKEDIVKEMDSTVTVVKSQDLPGLNKNNCSNVASESDFLKLRKNMASETSDDGMIEEAKKYFKSKCFTTEQVKNLSVLFLKDAGKYNFFDAAYTHVSDPGNFPSLTTELNDEYYINRFKAMLR